MIQTYVTYSKPTRPTGRTIAQQLGVAKFGVREPGDVIECLIRWGSSRPFNVRGFEINNAAGIRACANKIETFRRLQSAGVPVPPWHTNYTELVEHYGKGNVYLARRNYQTKGRGIVVLQPGDVPPPADFYSLYLEPSREYRVHVAAGRVIRIQGKYCDFPEQAKTNPFIRNYETGFRYRKPKQDLHHSRKEAAVKAVAAMGLDFGAVDLMVRGGHDFYVFEVNTGPACSPLTARCYAAAIAGMVRDRSEGRIKLAPGIWETAGSDELDDQLEDESYLEV